MYAKYMLGYESTERTNFKSYTVILFYDLKLC